MLLIWLILFQWLFLLKCYPQIILNTNEFEHFRKLIARLYLLIPVLLFPFLNHFSGIFLLDYDSYLYSKDVNICGIWLHVWLPFCLVFLILTGDDALETFQSFLIPQQQIIANSRKCSHFTKFGAIMDFRPEKIVCGAYNHLRWINFTTLTSNYFFPYSSAISLYLSAPSCWLSLKAVSSAVGTPFPD